jgi:MEMO1 family protein
VPSSRPPAVAGTFYPASPQELRGTIAELCRHAPAEQDGGAAPKALIVPHAGYRYSGQVAATAYLRLSPGRAAIRRVVLLGPVHRVAVRGLALPGVDAMTTPLGAIPLDRPGVDALADLPQVVTSAAAHAPEHSLEVHLPFLQVILEDGFRIVPLAVGDASVEEVVEVLDRLWGGPETLIVVSSDLSHYLPYPIAVREDRATADAILALDAGIDHAHACGATPVNGLLAAARARGLRAELLDLRNSGDTAGDRSRVVGYASFAFRAGTPIARPDPRSLRGRTLLAIARATIGRQLGLALTAREDADFLAAPGATFVTLHLDGQLRGCIGSLAPHRSLLDDVRRNARSAAFLDPRFTPLSLREFERVSVEVSELGPTTPIAFRDEAELLAQLRPGIDGLVLEIDGHRGTFLPQVWESLPAPADFLAALKRKAGLDSDHPIMGAHVARYTVDQWQEDDHVTH